MSSTTKPRIRLSPMSGPNARLWECGVIGVGRSAGEAFKSWQRQVFIRPDLLEATCKTT